MKTFLRLLLFTTTTLLFSQAVFSQWQGTGTIQAPFLISNIEDLEKITEHQFDSEFFDGTSSYTDIHFELTNNIEELKSQDHQKLLQQLLNVPLIHHAALQSHLPF